jgi:hypothetical protein
MVGMTIDGKLNAVAAMWGLLAVGGGIYAVTGQYPNSLPLADVFRQPPQKKRTRKRNT